MRGVKRYVMLSVLLILYVAAVSLLLAQFYTYQRAYYALGRLISHPSIEVSLEE